MHIPDGYLSPSTCAGLYAAAGPFWWLALRRVRRLLNTQAVPLLALFSGFSFVIMMFNLPLPGGTTGHAVGMGIASIVLGPWVSILAISVALSIQALFFGDGGITALGANCFNMAIGGSLATYAVYRLLGYGSNLLSLRRVLAAGLAGYAGINVAALCAALELGIQPLFFHDAAGAPLYAPYPLGIAIPAMMLGHLTFAGLAELIISAGTVRYLQRSDPALLTATAPDAPPVAPKGINSGEQGGAQVSRQLWVWLALAVLLTPIGTLAVGSAWGEWRATDFLSSEARSQMTEASRNQPPPNRVPAGLRRLTNLWAAPLARYEPSFVRNLSLGYFVSAAIGVALVVSCTLALRSLITPTVRTSPQRSGRTFQERTVSGLLAAVNDALFAERMACSRGFLQRMDARAKLAGFGALLVTAISVRQFKPLLVVLGAITLLALLSRIPFSLLVKRAWIPVLAFTGVIAVPALFLAPGHTLFEIPLLGWHVTAEGLTSASRLTLRAGTASTLALLLILSTPWTRLLRALRFFRVPVVPIIILEMCQRYIFLLLQTTQNMFEARAARHVGHLQPAEQRRLAAASAGVLLDKSLQLSAQVHTAMEARGYRGEIYLLDDMRMLRLDWLRLASLLLLAIVLIWWDR